MAANFVSDSDGFKKARTVTLFLCGVFGFVGYRLLGFDASSRIAAGLAVGAIALIGCGLGWATAMISTKWIDPDSQMAEIVAWTSLVSWIFPPLGFFLSALIYEWSKSSEYQPVRYFFLSVFAGMLSYANAGYGAKQNIADQHAAMVAAQIQ
jgi:hypothetical protein